MFTLSLLIAIVSECLLIWCMIDDTRRYQERLNKSLLKPKLKLKKGQKIVFSVEENNPFES